MIGDTTTLTTSSQRSNHLGTSYYFKNDTSFLQPVIADLRTRNKIIWEWCGSIGHKDDAYIICGHKFLSPSLRINMNKFNGIHGEEPNESPIERRRKPLESQFKSRTSPPKTSPVVSSTKKRLNHHIIGNGDVDIHP